MPRYIDADALSYRLEKRIDSVTDISFAEGLSEAIVEVELSPTVSPDEVRGVGKWIVLEPEIDLRSCSVCEHMVIRADCNYCPNCGARMGGVQDALS